MARFLSKKYPALVVKFGQNGAVKFASQKAEVSGDLADRLVDFAERHPEYEIEVVEADERLTPKQVLQQKARDLGLDDSGKVAEIEARIAAHEGEQGEDDDDPDEDPENGHEDDEDGDESDEDEDGGDEARILGKA